MQEIMGMLKELNETLVALRTSVDAVESELEIRRRRDFLVALCMADHPRLGAAATGGLSSLPPDIILLLV